MKNIQEKQQQQRGTFKLSIKPKKKKKNEFQQSANDCTSNNTYGSYLQSYGFLTNKTLTSGKGLEVQNFDFQTMLTDYKKLKNIFYIRYKPRTYSGYTQSTNLSKQKLCGVNLFLTGIRWSIKQSAAATKTTTTTVEKTDRTRPNSERRLSIGWRRSNSARSPTVSSPSRPGSTGISDVVEQWRI